MDMDLLALVLKYLLIILSAGGIVYHMLVLKSPNKVQELEKKLGAEFGVKTRIAPKLEAIDMSLHERLIKSKGYNMLSITFLIIVLVVLIR
ncbi:MAG: hypothetical protein V1727_06285 [Candidatus Omnitrophota bacterium]